MSPGKKSSNFFGGQVNFSFDKAVKKILPKGQEVFAHRKKQFKKYSIFSKNFSTNSFSDQGKLCSGILFNTLCSKSNYSC